MHHGLAVLGLFIGMEYILDGVTPVQCPSVVDWAFWMETSEIHVAHSRWITVGQVLISVSTVFLGLDYGDYQQRPLLFETMIFIDGSSDGTQVRYTDWEHAAECHAQIAHKARQRYPVIEEYSARQLWQERWVDRLLSRSRWLLRDMQPKPDPMRSEAFCDLMLTDYMIQMQNGVPVAELECRITDLDVDRYLNLHNN